jgi:hypothetical protein
MKNKEKRSAFFLSTPRKTNRHAGLAQMPRSYPQISTQVLWMGVEETCGMRNQRSKR